MNGQTAASSRAGLLFRGAGALLFLFSLAYFAYAYLTSFGSDPGTGDRLAAVTWDVMLFTGFAAHHSVFARERLRSVVAHLLPPPLERSAYVWISSLLFLAVCAWWKPIAGHAWEAPAALVWPLRLLQAAGVWLTLYSAAILNVRELAGWEAKPSEVSHADIEFKTVGPYGWVRHPIYSGWFLVVWAASPMTMTRLLFAIVSCVYLIIAIPFEERTMRATGRGAYERYMTRVRWRLVPHLY